MEHNRNEVLIFIPTYNERDNVEGLFRAIKKHQNAVDILFCDDNSPDGTGSLLDTLAKDDASVHVMHRKQKLGLGTAHLSAFSYAHKHKYKFLVTMDADFTHDPAYIPSMLAQKNSSDVVIGSRYIKNAAMSGWGRIRLPFTYLWRMLITKGLGMPYDCTGAFRLYNVERLKRVRYERLTSKGFSFCIELLYRMKESGLSIGEVPIKAHNRLHGSSKLSFAIMRECAAVFLRLFFEKRRKKRKK